MCLQASWYPRVSQCAPSMTYPNSSVLRRNKWPKPNQKWGPSLAVILTRTNRNSKCSLSAIGYWQTENRQTACIFIGIDLIYLSCLRLSALQSSLISQGWKVSWNMLCIYREHSRSAIRITDDNSFPVLSLSLMWQRSVWCQKWKLYCSYNAIKTLHRR